MNIAVKPSQAGHRSELLPLASNQRRAYQQALATISGSRVTLLKGEIGVGKSIIIEHVQKALGGRIYPWSTIFASLADSSNNWEEQLMLFLEEAFSTDDLVYLEDISIIDELGKSSTVDRPRYLPFITNSTYDLIEAKDKRLVISTSDILSRPNKNRGAVIEVDDFGAEDYVALLRNYLPQLSGQFDGERVGRVFKKLTGYQVATAAGLLAAQGKAQPDASDVIDAVASLKSRSNFSVSDVEDVKLDDLVGVDDIVLDLTRTIIIPMTQPELARELGLKQARGVLLHGSPGTGKTTIGRALARQMEGKFFLMDGTTMPGQVDKLLELAEASSPAVLFIDDADVIFANGENSGFARKLLTKLDGLESESIGNVCIVMTAMDVADMPPAIVRSGRVEVWLHMELPDAKKRADIIRYYAKSLPEDVRTFDERKLVDATEGFAPADLRGLVGDARGHIAYDRYRGRKPKPFEEYLLMAADEIRARKDLLAKLAGKR